MKRSIVRQPKAVLFICLSPLLFAAPALPESQVKVAKRTEQAIAALSHMTDADSLAAAGILSIGTRSDQALGFLARAIAAAPDRADLIWLQALRCAQLPPCDPEPIEHRLRELDPTNGAGWWGALARAGAAHDTAGVDAALAAIGQSDRLDTYWTTLVGHLGRALANTKSMSPAESAVEIIGYISAQSIPASQYISNSCKAERLQQAGVIELCRGIARALQRGDTYIAEMIGVAIAKRVWPEDSPEWKAAADERRVFEYRSSFYKKMALREITHPGEYLTLCAQNRREQDVLREQLIKAGINPNPPAG
jgi:hypothetical protein